jgi:hypothetical protein
MIENPGWEYDDFVHEHNELHRNRKETSKTNDR